MTRTGRRTERISDRQTALRVLATIDGEISDLTAAIEHARSRALSSQRESVAASAYAELGEAVLDVQRQIDEMERQHAATCAVVIEAADAEIDAIAAEADASIESIVGAKRSVARASGTLADRER